MNPQNEYLSGVFTKINRLNYKDLIIFLIPLSIFAYYLYVFYPGTMGWDTYYQFHQIATNNYNNWHPFFHTFIEMVCLKIYGNPVLISILQIVTFSTMWTVICKYHRDDDSGNRLFILQIIISLIFSLMPLNALYSILLYKDILFCYFLMFLCFLIKVMIDKKGNINLGFLLVLTVVMSFVAQLRPNGLYIILILLIVMSLYLFKNNRKKKFYILLPSLVILFILLIGSLNLIYDVDDVQKDVVLSKTGHLLADYDLNLELEENDKIKLHELMNESSIKENYELTFSDYLYNFAIDSQVYENSKSTYIFMAIKYSVLHPVHFMKYLFKSSPMVWDIVKKKNWDHYEGLEAFIIPDSNTDYYNTTNQVPSSNYDNFTFKNIGTPSYNNMDSIIKYIASNRLLDTLLDSPALYMYLSLIILAIGCIIDKSKELLFVYLPNMLNIIIVFFSMPAPQLRYLYSNFLVFYLLAIILIAIIAKKRLKMKNNTVEG